jgi:hypothetical protein
MRIELKALETAKAILASELPPGVRDVEVIRCIRKLAPDTAF